VVSGTEGLPRRATRRALAPVPRSVVTGRCKCGTSGVGRLIAQEARAAGVVVHEFAFTFAFTAASVGRLALALHGAIRNHRIALPPDEELADELASVRLRKNTVGVYRLDHDAGQHDDQAVALALGTHFLMDEPPAPEFIVFSETPAVAGEENAWGLQVLEHRGAYAWRPAADDPWLAGGYDDEDDKPRIVRTVQTEPPAT